MRPAGQIMDSAEFVGPWRLCFSRLANWCEDRVGTLVPIEGPTIVKFSLTPVDEAYEPDADQEGRPDIR